MRSVLWLHYSLDNLVPVPQCSTLITCAHAPPLSPTSNQLLLAHSTSAAAPVLVTGPSFLPETQAPISMLQGVPIAFSAAPGAIQSAGALPAPCRVPGCRITAYGSNAMAQSTHALCT